MKYGHWTSNTPKQDTSTAFVYLIEFNSINKGYIGFKTLLPKWEEYTSSSKYVNELLQEHDATFKIIEWFDDKSDAIAYESKLQSDNDVLNSDYWLNRTIAGKLYSGGEEHGLWSGYFLTPKGQFTTAADAAIAHETSASTVYNRCSSYNFKDWNRTDKDGNILPKENKKQYHTPDGVFDDHLSISEHYNVSKAAVSLRFLSDLHQWSEWYVILNDVPQLKETRGTREGCRIRKGITYITPEGEFDNLKEAAEHNNTSPYNVRYRCNAKSAKWQQWDFKKTQA